MEVFYTLLGSCLVYWLVNVFSGGGSSYLIAPQPINRHTPPHKASPLPEIGYPSMPPFTKRFLTFTILSLFLAIPTGLYANEDGEEVYKRSINACVFITGIDSKSGGAWEGSGTLIDAKKRLVLTNYHVVGPLEYVHVMFPMFNTRGEMRNDKSEYQKAVQDGKAIKAKVLCSDKEKDLAVIELEFLSKEAKAIPMADKAPGPGASIHSIGNPGASKLAWVYTPGNIRQVGNENYLIGNPRTPIGRFEINCKIISTTSPVNPGDSGGPLLNRRGELVGVTHATNKDDNISKFIDISEVYTLLQNKKITLSEKIEVAILPKDPPKVDPIDPKPVEPKTNPKVDPKPDPKDPPKKDPVVPVLSDEDKRADLMLKVAKGLRDDGAKRDKLMDVVRLFPNSPAAKEAKKILATLKD